MSNKTCGDCKNFQKICDWVTPATSASGCINFEKKLITNGDKIRQMSNEEFATDYATYNHIYDLYVARLCPPGEKLYTTMEEAVQANLAWLNAPADAPDTNVGTKESEGEDE